MTEIDFLKIAQDEMRDLRGDASTAEYIADLLEALYFACPQTRQDLNQQWDDLQGVRSEALT